MSKAFANEDKVAGIIKVTENIYKVDVNLLKVENGDGVAADNLSFYNPRRVGIGSESEAIGFSRPQIENLKSAIQEQGLLNPLVGRYKEGKVSLIEGHRRWAAINELIEEDASCFDPASGKEMSASCLYGFVLMRVYDSSITEEECFALSFQEDKTKEKFGPGAEIRFVHHCQMHDISDSRILEMLGNTPEWLRETKNIIRLLEDDEVILQALFTDRINRSAAKSLIQIEDLSERRHVFSLATEEAQEDFDLRVAKLRKQTSAIKNKIEVAKTKKVIAEAVKNPVEADKYDEEILALTGRQQDIEEEIEKAIPVVNPEAVRKGVAKSARSGTSRVKGVPSRLGASERISTRWRKYLEQLKERPQIGAEQVDERIIDMCLELLNSCTDKENSPEDFIAKWNSVI